MSVDPRPLTLAEFIAWEERQQGKHEFRDGAVFAMAGAGDDHNQIVANLIGIIRPQLRGTDCRVYANDMMLLTSSARYPDLLVTCDARDARERLRKRYPKLVIEVLSESTAAVDANEKLDEYQAIETLEEYVLIDSRKPSIRIFRRNGATLETGPALISGDVTFRSLDVTVPIESIYEDVDFARLLPR
jgi:Uma2 family endonuclease